MPKPSLYNPELIDETFLDLAKEGKMLAQIAAHFKVSYQTLNNWSKKDDHFKEIYTLGKTYIKAWWQKKGQESLYERDFNSTLWSMFVQSIGITTRARTVELLSLQDELEICTKNSPEIAKLLIKECACGNLSPQETVNLINAIASVVKIEEAVILEEKVKQLEKQLKENA